MAHSPSEPTIQIRRSFPGSDSYQSMSGRQADGEVVPPIESINSTNAEFQGVGGGALLSGSTSESQTRDKAPLLSTSPAGLLRSLSGWQSSGVSTSRRSGLSTFSGVFAPVSLSMFSVLLFLRLGFVVGQAGVLVTIAQLVISYVIVLCTILSMSAISTNGAIEGGGVYYMISRALGPEFGGSIGVLFFVANVFSCGLFISGFTEALVNNFGPGGYSIPDQIPESSWWSFCYEFFIALFVFGICCIGAALFAKTSLVLIGLLAVIYVSVLLSFIINNKIMQIPIPLNNDVVYPPSENTTIINGSSVVKFNYTGIRQSTLRENLYPDFGIDFTTMNSATFAIVFAVVFSGVTGIMAGANMSGELKTPNKSIPSGTLSACVVTFIVYVITTFLVGASCSRPLLKNNYVVLQNINIWPPFVVIGTFALTIFASMSNLIGASRVLQRLGEDRLFGFLLYPATIKVCNDQNPIVAVFLSWILVVLVLLIGALNSIAQIASIFFLLSYAGVNLSCLALDLASAPNFRPTFKYFTWHTSLVGFVGCVAMMFVINAVFTGVAIILLLLLLMALHYCAPMASWGSISQALIFHQVRKYLLLLDARKDHVKFWRPQILLLVANPKSCAPLIDFTNDLKKSGLYVLGHVRLDTAEQYTLDPTMEDMPFWLGLVDFLKIKAFVELTIAPSVRAGVQQLTRLSGLGAMKPNTVIMGFYDDEMPQDTFAMQHLWRKLKHSKLDRDEIEERFATTFRNGDPSGEIMPDSLKTETGSRRQLSETDYVHIIHDILRQNKNVCLARGFRNLDKGSIFSGASVFGKGENGRMYIDVWPVDIVRPHSTEAYFDNSCLFLLQLACILHMVPGWKQNTTVRVFLCVTSTQDIKLRETQLKELLSTLRISAKTVMVPWDHVICHAASQNNMARIQADSITPITDDRPIDFAEAPHAYVKSLSDTVKRYVGPKSAVVFMNLPAPPSNEDKFDTYLSYLNMLSEGLPPTLLVHGLSSVISTAL